MGDPLGMGGGMDGGGTGDGWGEPLGSDVGMDATGHVMEGRWEGCPRRGVLRFKRTEVSVRIRAAPGAPPRVGARALRAAPRRVRAAAGARPAVFCGRRDPAARPYIRFVILSVSARRRVRVRVAQRARPRRAEEPRRPPPLLCL
eukprot:gene4602-biopygen5770